MTALSAACLASTLFGDRVPDGANFTGGAIVGCGAKSTLGGARAALIIFKELAIFTCSANTIQVLELVLALFASILVETLFALRRALRTRLAETKLTSRALLTGRVRLETCFTGVASSPILANPAV